MNGEYFFTLCWYMVVLLTLNRMIQNPLQATHRMANGKVLTQPNKAMNTPIL